MIPAAVYNIVLCLWQHRYNTIGQNNIPLRTMYMYKMREYIGTEREKEYTWWKTGASACHLGRRPECGYPTPFIIIIVLTFCLCAKPIIQVYI